MSEATSKAAAFVAAHEAQADALGLRLAESLDDPDGFVRTLHEGLAQLDDPDYSAMIARVSPEVPVELAVRGPLLTAVQRSTRQALDESSSMTALSLAQRLIAAPERSVRLFAIPCLLRSLAEDPELSWQLMRRMAHAAQDWIEIDTLAGVWARGILAEDFRWAELEQLVYAEHAAERRLVGATLATMPHELPRDERNALLAGSVERALDALRQLMGDAEPIVQKSLSWALREWTPIDPTAMAEFLREQAELTVRERDGARAWVIRNGLWPRSSALAVELRARLAGIRRDARAPSTSIASTRAAAFAAALTASTDAVAAQGGRYTRSRA